MERKHGFVLLRVLVSVGIIIFAVNSAFFYIESSNNIFLNVVLVGFYIQVLLGVLIAVLALKITKKAYQFFIGLILSGWGILSGLITFILPYSDEYWWPLYLIEAGIFLVLAGIIRYKKIKFGYLMPAAVLVIMGLWFCLFSFKIMKVPFKTVVVFLGPAFIVLIGILMVAVFLIQQHHKKLIVIDEESGDFDDEEISFPKID